MNVYSTQLDRALVFDCWLVTGNSRKELALAKTSGTWQWLIDCWQISFTFLFPAKPANGKLICLFESSSIWEQLKGTFTLRQVCLWSNLTFNLSESDCIPFFYLCRHERFWESPRHSHFAVFGWIRFCAWSRWTLSLHLRNRVHLSWT